MENQKIKAGRPKSEEKRTNILLAATKSFLEFGYSQTSMNLVANEAQVSKQTVYSHFSNKDALFSAVIEFKCAEYQLDKSHLQQGNFALKEIMLGIGEQFSSLMQDPQVTAMYRVLIGEVNANPHVAELFYEAGPQYAINALGAFIENDPAYKLSQDEARYWACAFFNLLKGDSHMRSLLGLPFKMSKQEQIDEVKKVTDIILSMLHKYKQQ
ncbi:TetR/AcrR family transcriptional regulator [Paraglaciecola sp.]|uniref:TetR/AcrR family transcriptional regulator n=1 Tax=Paraglaciecola sp. TaxID=1920173 RepID=UPI003EF7EC96